MLLFFFCLLRLFCPLSRLVKNLLAILDDMQILKDGMEHVGKLICSNLGARMDSEPKCWRILGLVFCSGMLECFFCEYIHIDFVSWVVFIF